MKYNNNEVNNIKFNGTDINVLKLNGVEVWRKDTPPPLPEGYVKVEYIDNNGGAYIDTGVIIKTDPYISTDMQVLAIGDLSHFGYISTPNGLISFNLNIQNNNNVIWYIRYGGTSVNQFVSVDGHIVNEYSVLLEDLHKVEISKDGCYLDSIHTNTFKNITTSDTWKDNVNSILIGKGHYGSNNKNRFATFIIKDNNILKFNGIPCINPSNEVGMYDTVTQTFFGNSGTGEFIAGPPVN